MNIRVLLALLLITPVTVLADVCSTDKNVKDYFLSIPHTKLKIADDSRGYLKSVKDRELAIENIDIRNGFIEIQNKTVLSKINIALFRDRNRRPVIIKVSDGASVQTIDALACVDNDWIVVTKTLFPQISHIKIAKLYKENEVIISGEFATPDELSMIAHTLVRYELPKIGREIEAYASHPDLSQKEQKQLFSFTPKLSEINWN